MIIVLMVMGAMFSRMVMVMNLLHPVMVVEMLVLMGVFMNVLMPVLVVTFQCTPSFFRT